MRKPSPQQRFVVEPLEDRIQLAGDLAVLIGADGVSVGVNLPDAGSEPVAVVDQAVADENSQLQQVTRQLFIVDAAIDNHEDLVNQLRAQHGQSQGFDIHVLDAQSDGITQITSILDDHENIGAVHILSHGSSQGVQIGATFLTSENVSGHSIPIGQWSESLSDQADLLIYGCNLAGSEGGQNLINTLSLLTGADVAASTDLTGATALGGDWDLEFQSGSIEALSASGLYSGLLAVQTTVDVVGGDLIVADSLGTNTADLTFTADGTNLTITDNNGDQIDLLDELDGDIGDGTSSVTIALSNFSGGSLNILTHGGSDTLVLGNLQLLAGQSLDLDSGGGGDAVTVVGNVQATGSGSVSLASSGGVVMDLASSISTDDGDISILGNIAQSSSGNFAGLLLNGAVITTGAGSVSLSAFGGDTGTDNIGVHIAAGSIVRSTGTGPAVGTISISGNGGGGTDENHGIRLSGASSVSSAEGNVLLVGLGGGSNNAGKGIFVTGNSLIESTGTGPSAATITLDGTAMDGGGAGNIGTEVNSGAVSSVDGDITLVGVGGDGTGSFNDGVLIFDDVRSSGDGNITITGMAGTGVSSNAGIEIVFAGALVEAVNGNIVLNGTGNGSSASDNDGVVVNLNASVKTTGAGDIDITGIGTSNGIGSGVRVIGGGTVEASGSGTITALGNGMGTSGIDVTANVLANGGDILLTGGSDQVGSVDDDAGVAVDGGTVTTNSTGMITLTGTHSGTGDADGVYLNDGVLRSVNGDIEINGDASDTGEGIQSDGVQLIEAIGTGQIRLNGLAGGTNDDVFLEGMTGNVLGTGGIVINADRFGLQDTGDTLQGSGSLSIIPRTPSTAIGVGGGSGTLNITDDLLASILDGFSSIMIGDITGGIGAVDIDSSLFLDDITIVGGTISVTEINAGPNTVTLIARNGDISDGGDAGRDVSAGTLNATATTGIGSSTNRVETSVGSVDADGGAGGVFIDNDGDLTIDGNLLFQIRGDGGPNAPNGHDKMVVGGLLTLAPAATLNLDFTGLSPGELVPGQEFRIIENQGVGAVTGNFTSFAEGDIVATNVAGSGLDLSISYAGGNDGNDVVLSVDGSTFDFSAASYVVSETDGLQVFSGIEITRTGNIASAASLEVLLTGTTATAGLDFSAGPVAINFDPGDVIATVPITVIGELIVEAEESVSLSMTNISIGSIAGFTQPTAVLSITDNDLAEVSIETIVNGGESGPLDMVFTVSQSAQSSTDTVVELQFSGAAASGFDLDMPPTEVTILAGQTTATISVSVIDDALVEGNESLEVSLSGIRLADSQISIDMAMAKARSIIADDDRNIIPQNEPMRSTTDQGFPMEIPEVSSTRRQFQSQGSETSTTQREGVFNNRNVIEDGDVNTPENQAIDSEAFYENTFGGNSGDKSLSISASAAATEGLDIEFNIPSEIENILNDGFQISAGDGINEPVGRETGSVETARDGGDGTQNAPPTDTGSLWVATDSESLQNELHEVMEISDENLEAIVETQKELIVGARNEEVSSLFDQMRKKSLSDMMEWLQDAVDDLLGKVGELQTEFNDGTSENPQGPRSTKPN